MLSKKASASALSHIRVMLPMGRLKRPKTGQRRLGAQLSEAWIQGELWQKPMECDHRATARDHVSRVTDQEALLLTKVLEVRKVES